MSNSAFPGWFKIGKSAKDPSIFRISELNSTGVPLPFSCEYYAFTEQYDWLEGIIHSNFDYCRVNPQREFFEIECEAAIREISEKAKSENILIFEKFFNNDIYEYFNRDVDKDESILNNFSKEEPDKILGRTLEEYENFRKHNDAKIHKLYPEIYPRKLDYSSDEFLKNYQEAERNRRKSKNINSHTAKKDDLGRTKLHYAVLDASEALIISLIEQGFDPLVADNGGKTPWDFAKENVQLRGTRAYQALQNSQQRKILK